MGLIITIANGAIVHLGMLALLLPVIGVFFYRDSKISQTWRSDILNSWSLGNIELEIFKSTLTQLPYLPEGTVKGMLSTLPDCGIAAVEFQMSITSRKCISTLVLFINAIRGQLILLRSVYASIVAGLVVISLYSRSWAPLIGCLLAFTYPLVKKMWIRRGARNISTDLNDQLTSDKIDTERVQETLARYNLKPYQAVTLVPFELTDRDTLYAVNKI